MPPAAWAEGKGMGPATLWQRLSRGWDLEAALTEPVEPRKPYERWLPRNPNPKRRGRKPGPR